MRPAGYLEAVVTRAGARDDSAPASPGRRSQGTGACALPWPRPAALHAASSESRTMSMTSAVSAQDTACAGRGTIAQERSRASLEERARPPPEPERGSQTRLRASSATNDARSGSSALWTAWTRSPSMPRDDRARSQKSSSSTGACTAAQSSSDAYGGRGRSPVVSDTKKFVDGASHAVWPVMEGGLAPDRKPGGRARRHESGGYANLSRVRASARAQTRTLHTRRVASLTALRKEVSSSESRFPVGCGSPPRSVASRRSGQYRPVSAPWRDDATPPVPMWNTRTLAATVSGLRQWGDSLTNAT